MLPYKKNSLHCLHTCIKQYPKHTWPHTLLMVTWSSENCLKFLFKPTEQPLQISSRRITFSKRIKACEAPKMNRERSSGMASKSQEPYYVPYEPLSSWFAESAKSMKSAVKLCTISTSCSAFSSILDARPGYPTCRLFYSTSSSRKFSIFKWSSMFAHLWFPTFFVLLLLIGRHTNKK